MSNLVRWILIAVCIWLQQIYAQETEITINNNGPAKLVNYKDRVISLRININSDVLKAQYLFIEVNTTHLLEITHGYEGEKSQIACTAAGRTTCVFKTSDIKQYVESPQGYKIKVKITGEEKGDVIPYLLGIGVADSVPFLADQEHKIVLHQIKKLITTATITADPKAKKLRFQIRAHTGSEFTNLRAFVNFNKENAPDAQQHDAELEHLDSHRIGIISRPSEPLFCSSFGTKTQTACMYTFSIEGDDIHSLDLTLAQSTSREEIVAERTYVEKS